MRNSRKRRELERKQAKKRAKRRVFRRRLLMLLTLVLLVAAANFAYVFAMKGHFYHNTTLNGYDVSGKNVDEVMALLEGDYDKLSLTIREQGTDVLSMNFKDLGYHIDEERLKEKLSELMNGQSYGALVELVKGNTLGVNAIFAVDETAFREAVTGSGFSVPRVATEDAKLIESNGEYAIQPEVYGNEFDDASLQTLVQETIDEKLVENSGETTVVVDVPESLYRVPTVTKEDQELNDTMDLYNKFCKAKITHTFGEETRVLDWSVIKGWLTEGGEIDEDQVTAYVVDLAASYDTRYNERTFLTSYGDYVTLPSNDYGFRINQEEEISQLMADIYANTSVEREPIYAERGYSRNGRDDLNGTYVEVNLTAQHMWFYKNGELIVESDVVSGLPTEKRETAQGAFAIPYKQSPANLVGQGGGPGESWDVMVQYWMPFHDGQGLHDASWQSVFGGNVYTYAGSQGCVNLPPDVAAIVYEYMEENVAVILYKQ